MSTSQALDVFSNSSLPFIMGRMVEDSGFRRLTWSRARTLEVLESSRFVEERVRFNVFENELPANAWLDPFDIA